MSKKIEMSAHYHRADECENTIIIVYPSSAHVLQEAGETWNDVKEGLHVLLTKKNGFSEGSFVISRPTDNQYNHILTAEIEFIGEGIVMAKLQGYIN